MEINNMYGGQPIDAKILTPTGWATMGDLKINDEIIGVDGKTTKVLNIYSKGIQSIYKVTTTDEISTECVLDQPFFIRKKHEKNNKNAGDIKILANVINTLKTPGGQLDNYIDRNEIIKYYENKLPISPYTLGAILGDGSIGNGHIHISGIDLEIINKVSKEIELLNCFLKNYGGIIYNIQSLSFGNKTAKPVKITNIKTKNEIVFKSVGLAVIAFNLNRKIPVNKSTFKSWCENNKIKEDIRFEFLKNTKRWQNPVKEILYNLGLSNHKAWEKFIPNQYKYASINDRIELLRGLMDTDGTIQKNGTASYTTTSKQLALDIIELVKSLGGRAAIHSRNRIGENRPTKLHKEIDFIKKRISYEFIISMPQEINPFFLSRKANRHKREYMQRVAIKSAEYVGEKEVKCILTEDVKNLYITDNFIITHGGII